MPAVPIDWATGRRIWGWVLLVSHGTAASPCPGADVRGAGALYFDFQDNSALLGSQHCCALACRTPTGRWALLRRVVQAPRHLLPNLVCLTSAQLRAKGSPVVGLHTGISVPLVLYPCCSSGLSILILAQPSPCVVEGEAVTHPGTSHCSTSSGLQRAFCFQPGVLLPRPFATEHPRALHARAVPGGAVELQEAASSDTTGPPSQGHVFPNHSNPAAFEQTL